MMSFTLKHMANWNRNNKNAKKDDDQIKPNKAKHNICVFFQTTNNHMLLISVNLNCT